MNVRLAPWTVGMALVGLFFTIEGGIPSHSTILLGSLVGAGVGFGLGTIFSRLANRKRT
jgi:hypothetical protein